MARRRPITERVGERVTALREHQALSQAELARRAGIAASHVNSIERGLRAPTINVLEKLATGLRVPITAFFDEEPRPAPTRSEKVWFEVMNMLRDRDAEYLRAVRGLLQSFARAVDKRR
jgi:transcriptional regulator with XRE-family HTH domain